MDYRYTFDQVVEDYEIARPDYPGEIISRIIDLAELNEDANILEVGVGTGKMTASFSSLGYEITGLELGQNLAAFSQKKFSQSPNVKIINTAFEDWASLKTFDLFLSAQAFHWIEPGSGIKKVATHLKNGGGIALVWHMDKSQDTDFYKASTPLFRTYVNPADSPDRSRHPSSIEIYKQALNESKLFGRVDRAAVKWQETYDDIKFIRLLSTFSPVIALDKATRAIFLAKMKELIKDFEGKVVRNYETNLIYAKKQT